MKMKPLIKFLAITSAIALAGTVLHAVWPDFYRWGFYAIAGLVCVPRKK